MVNNHDNSSEHRGGLSRRALLRLGATATAGTTLLKSGSGKAEVEPSDESLDLLSSGIEEATIADLQAAMASGQLSARQLVQIYLRRVQKIDRRGPSLKALIETNPDALAIADHLDRERAYGRVRGPLHGIPIALKDNIDTADRMFTAAGSRALTADGLPALHDATVAAKLRKAGAIVFGKANLSEWANFRSTRPVSGWSGRGRLGRNPYVLDRSQCGSSSGSAAAVSANLVSAAVGTETNGSILCPGSINGVVAIKPTVGLTSRAGVVPISHIQDCVGPFGRTVADAATVLGALTGVDPRDFEATRESEGHFYTDYTQFLDATALKGARIGILRNFTFTDISQGVTPHEHTNRVFNSAVDVLRSLGAVVVDPALDPRQPFPPAAPPRPPFGMLTQVLLDEFKSDIDAYLATRPNLSVHTLEDLIAFNIKDAAAEMPYFLQELFLAARDLGRPLTSGEYQMDRRTVRSLGREQGIDRALREHHLDALFAPTRGPACAIDLLNGDRFFVGSSTASAIAEYPTVTVPAGFVFDALPIGVSFMGTRWSEAALIRFAYAFEQATRVRKPPEFLRTLQQP